MTSLGGAAALLGALALYHSTPPIQNPGAPGQAGRTLSAAEAVAMSRSTHTPADVRFMQHMIVHHNQAVEMVALIADRSASDAVAAIGARISASQSAEMAMMSQWLTDRGEAVDDPGLHAGHGSHGGDHAAMNHAGMDHGDMDHGEMDHGAATDPYHTPLMPGMLSPAQMDAMQAASGPAFDRLFLTGMIHHHQGALDMVDGLLAEPGNGEDPQLSEFLTHVVADQSAEILRMQSALDTIPGAEAPSRSHSRSHSHTHH